MNITSLALSLSGLLFGVTAIAGIVFGHKPDAPAAAHDKARVPQRDPGFRVS